MAENQEDQPVNSGAHKPVPEPAQAETTPPPPSHAPQPSTALNGLAIASLIVGIVAFVSGWIPFWGLLAGAAAIVLGILALKKPGGKGLSITGIVAGGLAALTSLVFTILFFVALVAGTAYLGQASKVINDQTAQADQMISAKKDFAKGETATFGTYEVKVNSVQRNYVDPDGFYKPGDGNEFIVVNLTVKNTASESSSIGPSDFRINENGAATSSSFLSVQPEFDYTNLDSGASATGNIVYEVTKDATNLKLQYETVVYGSNYESKNLVYTLAI